MPEKIILAHWVKPSQKKNDSDDENFFDNPIAKRLFVTI